MKLIEYSLGKYVFDESTFILNSREIISDFLFCGRECSFIYLNNLECEMILYYKTQFDNAEKKQLLIDRFYKNTNVIFDDESFDFMIKNLIDAYIACDALILDNNVINQSLVYDLLGNKKEVVSQKAFNNMNFLLDTVNNKKILYISFKDLEAYSFPFDNVKEYLIERSNSKSYQSFYENLDLLKMRIMIIDFDIAFINLGELSNIINKFITQSLHKVGITLGGNKIEK